MYNLLHLLQALPLVHVVTLDGTTQIFPLASHSALEPLPLRFPLTHTIHITHILIMLPFLLQAMSGFFNPANMPIKTILQQAKSITNSLLQLSAIPKSPKSSSLLPLDLNLTNYVIKTAIGWLDSSLSGTLNSTDLPTEVCIR